MIVPQSKSQTCSIINSVKLANAKLSRPILKSSPPKYKSFHKLEHYKYAPMLYTLNLATRKVFSHKIALKRGFRFDHDNWYINNIERPFFLRKIEARREPARIGLKSKHHHRPQMIQFDVLDDPRWHANKEEKQGRFRLDHYRPFAFQHGSMVYNPRDHYWIPNATDDPWANCPAKTPEHEYHVIHTLGWSLQLTNITLTFDVASEPMYYGKDRIKCNLERDRFPPGHAIKTTIVWDPENHCRIFDVGRSHARMINFKKDTLLKHSKRLKHILVTNTCHTFILVVFKNTFIINLHFHVLRFSQNISTNAMKIGHIMPLKIKTFIILYTEGFSFVSGKPSSDFNDTHRTIPDGPTSLTPHTKANIRDGYVIPQESKLYHKLEKYALLQKRKLVWSSSP